MHRIYLHENYKCVPKKGNSSVESHIFEKNIGIIIIVISLQIYQLFKVWKNFKKLYIIINNIISISKLIIYLNLINYYILFFNYDVICEHLMKYLLYYNICL